MDLMEGIKTRRSVRHFEARDVPRDLILEILNAATCAPSACNMASWQVVVVTIPGEKKRLAAACINQNFVAEASFVLVFCEGNPNDVAAAIQNSLLAAHYHGLAGCWVGSMEPAKVRDVLNIPEEVAIRAVVPFGYPAEPATHPGKRSAFEFAHWETWAQKEADWNTVLAAIRKDTQTALDDLLAHHKQIQEQAQDEGYLDPLYRWEEKYSAFVFSNLLVRWVEFIKRYLETRRPELGKIRLKLEQAVERYRSRRGELLGCRNINDSKLIAHEREHCTEIFIKLLEECLEWEP